MTPSAKTGPDPAPVDAHGGDLTGRTLGDYHILRRLGEGGMGQVYLAEQVSLKRKVALKILRADLAANPTSLQRFKSEAELVAKATHANIVQVYAIGEADGVHFMALEYVEGRNLREFLTKKGPPDLLLVLRIMAQTAAALQRASELGIIHRDIKPENILLTRAREVKVADFGLSRCLADEQRPLHLTQSGVTMGTPLYMSPEQVEGKPLDSRTDIYSFGVTCYHMLAGEPPFLGDSPFEVALKHVRDEPKPLPSVRPDLPPALCAIVHKMMAKDPAQRYQTGRELLKDVLRVREGLSGVTGTVGALSVSVDAIPAVAPPVPAPPPAPPRPARRWLPFLAGGSLLLALLAGGGLAWLRHGAAETPPPPAPSADNAGLDDALPALNDEEALRQSVERYLQPKNLHAPDGSVNAANASTGLGLCVDLSLLYLEQHRLDEADKLFGRLDEVHDIHPYHTLGHIGRAIVLALRDQPTESNRVFREVKNEGKKPDQEVAKKVWGNPQFRFWLAEAARYNLRNGLPDDQVPDWLRKVRDPAPRP